MEILLLFLAGFSTFAAFLLSEGFTETGKTDWKKLLGKSQSTRHDVARIAVLVSLFSLVFSGCLGWESGKNESRFKNDLIKANSNLISSSVALSNKVDALTLDLTKAQSVLETLTRTGLLTPADKATPNHVADLVDSGETVVICGSLTFHSVEPEWTFLRYDEEPLISVGRSETGGWFSAKLFNESGEIVAQIVRNQFHLNEGNYFRMERTASDLHVFDRNGNLAISVEYLRPNLYRLTGSFYLRKGVKVSTDDTGTTIGRLMRILPGARFGQLNMANTH